MPPLPPAVDLTDVGVERGGTSILREITCRIERGHITAIIGPNGAGKTTLLLAMLGLIKFSGSIVFPDEAGTPSRPRIGYVPQNLDLDRQSPITVVEFLSLDRQWRPIWLGIGHAVREDARQALARLQVEHLLDRPLARLSGGEVQRVLLAGALQKKPNILFLDEPVSGVDLAGGHLFCDVLEDLKTQHHLSVVMVSHDLSVVSEHATRVICINRTLACQGDTPEVLTPEQLLAIYGIHSGLYEHHPKQPPPCQHGPGEPHHHHDH